MIQILADDDVIKDRIRKRVNQMIYQHNGLDECFKVFNQLIQPDVEPDFTKGILQAIGYKEFYPLFQSLHGQLEDENDKILEQIQGNEE